MATEKKSLLLRIDPQLWAALEKLAATELRSANSQIEYLLREAVLKRGMKLGGDESMANEGMSNAAAPSKARKK